MRDFENLTCRYAQLLLWDYLTGRLPEERMEDVERHLATCESCRNELEQMKQTHRWIQLGRASEVPEPRSGWYALKARLAQEELIPAPAKRHTVPVALLALLFLLPGFLAGRLLSTDTVHKPPVTIAHSQPGTEPVLVSTPESLAPQATTNTALNTAESTLLTPDLTGSIRSKATIPTSAAQATKQHPSTAAHEKRTKAFESSTGHHSSTARQLKQVPHTVVSSNTVVAEKSNPSAPSSTQTTSSTATSSQTITAQSQFVLTSLQPDSPNQQTIY